MKSKKWLFFTSAWICWFQITAAQDATAYKFGKITVSDFNLPALKIDSGANAVIISDIGIAGFEGNYHGQFTIVFTHYMRVKIMNKNGLDIGSKVIDLYHDSEESEELFSIRGSTFNLENGLIQETILNEKGIFKEIYNKNYVFKKFTMPALKEGSIFDLEYTVKSPFYFRLDPWFFQGTYPRLWSEFVVTIPPPYHYVMRSQGDQNFEINTTKEVLKSYAIHEDIGGISDKIYHVSGPSISKRWVKKNVPALQEEPFTTTIDNYYSKVSFQLQYIQWNNGSDKHFYTSDWIKASKELMDDENFGHALNHENNWMSDELKGIIRDALSDEDKAHRIFSYIRDNFKAVAKDGYSKNRLYVDKSLKDVFKNKEGNVAEINLLLSAMLRKADINADPVILSTRDHGIANVTYPLMAEYNYVICIAYPGNKVVFLDASDPANGYGQLPERCYNGWAHIMNAEKPLPIEFSSDSLWETSLTSVIVVNDDKGKSLGSFKTVLGKNESNQVRNEIAASSEKTYEKKIRAQNGENLDMENFGFDSLTQFDFPLAVRYDFELKNISSSDNIYFNPMLGESYQSNPFKSMERLYPVEMPYRMDQTFIMNMQIPAGYQVEELPKSARVAYNENEGIFEYLIQKGEDNIQMRVKLKLNKAFFPTDEYATLRDFFAYVVKKENEQIVFKKIKQ